MNPLMIHFIRKYFCQILFKQLINLKTVLAYWQIPKEYFAIGLARQTVVFAQSKIDLIIRY